MFPWLQPQTACSRAIDFPFGCQNGHLFFGCSLLSRGCRSTDERAGRQQAPEHSGCNFADRQEAGEVEEKL